LGTERLVLIAAPNHPLAKLHELDTEMLADHTLLLSRVDCSYRRILEQMLQELKCEPKMILEFNSVAAIISNVIAGLGVTLIPAVAVAAHVKSKKLVVLPWTENELEVAQLMIWHHDKWLTPVLNAFMEATREILKT
jgi:DNA-binding transcriptional LysR family regulator